MEQLGLVEGVSAYDRDWKRVVIKVRSNQNHPVIL